MGVEFSIFQQPLLIYDIIMSNASGEQLDDKNGELPMKINYGTCILLILAFLLTLIASSAVAFVGSDACLECHYDQHSRWEASGHPYKLIKVVGESPDSLFPTFSRFPNDPVLPPVGYTWEDISYTIGGYGWKMRWVDNNGYIITPFSGQNQYNFENQTWSDYHMGEIKPYNCGACHTTGWVNSDDGIPDNNQDGLEGLLGTFFDSGIHCERCHGEGDAHVSDPASIEMVIDDSSELCGQCHSRLPDHHIASSGGFIKHHEQYDEWLHSPHATGPGCNDCHDPHSSVKFDPFAPGEGTLNSCEECHLTQAANMNHLGIPECTDCHMPKATKSAVVINSYQGDLATHIWSINTAPVGREGMFTPDGMLVLEDAQGQSQITLDFACYGCHQDENGIGGSASMKTLQELSARAIDIHGTLSDVEDENVPAAVALTGAHPNPFNPQTSISFSVAQSQRVTISVFNMAGQEVARLTDQNFSVGEHSIQWNGKNTFGRVVASGMYLVQIRARNVAHSLKIQLVR